MQEHEAQRVAMKRLGLIRDDDFAREQIDFVEKIFGTPLIGYIEDRDGRPTCMITHGPAIPAQLLSAVGIIRGYVNKRQSEAGIFPGITGNAQTPQQVLASQIKQASEKEAEQAKRDKEKTGSRADAKSKGSRATAHTRQNLVLRQPRQCGAGSE